MYVLETDQLYIIALARIILPTGSSSVPAFQKLMRSDVVHHRPGALLSNPQHCSAQKNFVDETEVEGDREIRKCSGGLLTAELILILGILVY